MLNVTLEHLKQKRDATIVVILSVPLLHVCVSLQVNKYLECFCLSQEKLLEISARLKNELIRGLEKETQDMMLATFVTATADGTGNN